MKSAAFVVLQALPLCSCGSEPSMLDSKQTLVSLDNSTWVEQDDPVMGGGSRGTWSVRDGAGVWSGAVTNVTFLNAPGFCAVKTVSLAAVDASAYINGGLVLKVRTSTPEYSGFKLRFASPNIPLHHGQHGSEGSHSRSFKVPPSQNGEWQSVFLPFTEFSWDHSDYTGDCDTQDPDGFQHRCCSSEDLDVCPTSEQLGTIDGFNIYAEGVEGQFQLDFKEIAVVNSAPAAEVMV